MTDRDHCHDPSDGAGVRLVRAPASRGHLQDRLFRLRCAAEDLAGAARDGEGAAALGTLASEVARAAADLERLR